MRSLLFLSAVSLSTLVFANPALHARDLERRNIIYDGQISDTYDFVIAGGGTAGLVLAARLSEDTNTSVLVLEAGDTGDAVKNSVDVPGNAYYSSLLGTSYDWQYTTVPQPNANNRAIPWARGKLLGGSSAVNGMYMVRPSKLEVDAWAGLIPGGDEWNWNNLFAAMKKSENFTEPSDDIKAAGAIMYDKGSHGTDGPIHSSYPGFILPVVGNWTATLEGIGIPRTADSNGGEGWGAFIATSSINPSNWTRSYSRSAYIDPLPYRSNLAILANATVTRLIISNSTSSGDKTVSAVEFASARGAQKKTVNVRKEVILAGGAIGSPQILQLSGVGPKDVLDAAGVPVNVELPGVGQHLQDHISTQVVWKASVDTAASIHSANNQGNNGQSTPFLSFINSATAYANISDLVGPDFTPSFHDEITSALDSSASSLVPSQDPAVIAGYKAIYTQTANILTTQAGQVEILLSLTGTAQGGAQSLAIQAALQHPFSQGRLYINSCDAFDYPVIDPNYLSHSADVVMLREGLKLARKLGNTAPLSAAVTEEVSPGPSVSSDDDWDKWLAGAIGTEFHPSCTCAMLPKEQGGVVDANLKVYGLANARVVDASIFPIQFAAHLQAPVYGLAEQAANIIRAKYNGVALPSASSVAPPSATTTTPIQTSPANNNGSKSSLSLSVSQPFGLVFALLSAFVGTLLL
ncbi:alcohol oxidase [Panus rudis PR-1116 ss-1]|nr:alcohol oxidase [Panus rudis PR-1116 ss-1]